MANTITAQVESAFQRALSLHQGARLEEARVLYEHVLKLHPGNFHALHLLGVIALQTRRPERAVQLIGEAIRLGLDSAAAHNNLGNALSELRRYDAAVASYDKAIAMNPNGAEAHNNRGNALRDLGRYEAAIASYDRAIALDEKYTDAHQNRGLALIDVKRYADAVASLDKAISIRPDQADAHHYRGNALVDLRQFEEAIGSYENVIALRPESAAAHIGRGNALRELGRLYEAMLSYDRAIAIRPDIAEAHNNRGIVLVERKQMEAALASYDRAIAIRPNYAEACCNRGNALKELNRLEAALASYDRAIAIKSDYSEAYNNRANVLRELKQYAAAAKSYDQAIAINAETKYARAMRLLSRMHTCDWSGWHEEITELEARIERGEAASTPFCMIGLIGSAALQRRAAEAWVRGECPPNDLRPAIVKRAKRDKIRIGYFSADFHDHATMHLMAGLLEMHDREKFHLAAFSFGPESRSAMRMRVLAACDAFIDVRDRSDLEVAMLSRDLQIDIAVDLKGFTRDNRAGIFACRAAPIQISYLGYPGTMGAEYIDYLIGDRTLIPEGSERHYSEKIVFLPDSYQVNDHSRAVSEKRHTRAEHGLPPTGFVFCCFNSNYKITPDTFDGWMRILNRVEGSMLWLLEENVEAAANLRREALRRGVQAERLVFARRIATPEHLARHGVADLFLDTLPCNAHTTASDALWAGLPVLTCIGEAFAGRVTASLLNAVRLPELITTTQEQYEELAVTLASRAELLADIKTRLVQNRLKVPLFDTLAFTRHIEAAYTEIYGRYQSGAPADHILIESD